MKPWRRRLHRLLSDDQAPPLLTRDLLARFARTANDGRDVPVSTLTYWIRQARDNEELRPVQRGLYLNRLRRRAPNVADAVPWLVPDAVVSLNTVLGDAGVLNNPVKVVTAVVPIDAGRPPPSLGRLRTGCGTFHFFGLPRRILEAGRVRDRLDTSEIWEHARATPEKALLDWLYLGHSPRSRRTPPPRTDIDTAMLDHPRLSRLANEMNLRATLDTWLMQAEMTQP